ncbi:Uncharacterised protein [Streptococcus pneumoniae]|nr:Uncharacterised protein [Streptococcus pneumoniae]CKO08612.1 Uncharacterised protein [Streptococcus pneumoniae]
MIKVSTIWNICNKLTIGTFNDSINRFYHCVHCVMILGKLDIVLNHAKCNKWTNRIVGNNDILWSKRTISINGFNDFLNTCIAVSTTLCNDDTFLIKRKIFIYKIFCMRNPVSMNTNYNFFNTWLQDKFFNCMNQNRSIT